MQPDESVEGLPKVDVNIAISDLVFEKKISRGGFGEVWKASYLGTDVAVKRMLRPDDAFVMRLIQRELSALKEIRHPNICLFLGVSMEESQIHAVTEFIEGGTLWKLLKKKDKPLAWHVRIHLAVEIAKAITFLHAKNIMHRDLKSENILVDKNMQTKVCDFGLSRAVLDEKDTRFMTKAGTETWMAPEIIVGSPYSLKADIFSFGVVLYELIVRDRPPDRSPMEGYEFLEAEFRAEFPADCPPELADLAVACVSSPPENRPNIMDALTLLKDLKSKLKEELKNAKSLRVISKLPPPISASSEMVPPPLGAPSSPLIANLMPPPPMIANLNSTAPPPPPAALPSSPLPMAPGTPTTDSAKLKKKKKKVMGDGEAPLPPMMLPAPFGSPLAPGSPLPPPLSMSLPSLPLPISPLSSPRTAQNTNLDFVAPPPILPPPDFSSVMKGPTTTNRSDMTGSMDRPRSVSPLHEITSLRDPKVDSPEPTASKRRKSAKPNKDRGPKQGEIGSDKTILPPPIITPETSPRGPKPNPNTATLPLQIVDTAAIPPPIDTPQLPPAEILPPPKAPSHHRKQSKDKNDPNTPTKHKRKASREQ